MSDEDQAVGSQDDTEVNEDAGQEASPKETITVDGKELTQDEVTELVKKGMTLKDFEEKAPETDIWELNRAYTQSRQEIAELKKAQEIKKEPEPEDEESVAVNRLTSHPLFQQKVREALKEDEQRLREDLALEKKLEELEARYDGADGRPKFDRRSILDYGLKNQMSNPEAIYKLMNEDALDQWKLKSAMSRKPRNTFVDRSGGNGAKAPNPKKATSFDEAEAFAQADYEASQEF